MPETTLYMNSMALCEPPAGMLDTNPGLGDLRAQNGSSRAHVAPVYSALAYITTIP
jgi:hypothetical protein